MTASTDYLGLSPADNFSRYLREIRSFPMLEEGEEFELAREFREKGKKDAANKLINSHLRLVAKIANRYKGYGLPIEEIISEGNVGLIQAVNRFDPDRGFKLATYAMWWIKASIQEYVLHSWSMVKIGTTTAQKKLFFNLKKQKQKLAIFEDRELSTEEVKKIAKKLSVSKKDVVSMNRRISGKDYSLNAPVGYNDQNYGSWQDSLEDDRANQEEIVGSLEEYKKQKLLFLIAAKFLNERERFIIKERRLKERATTLEELSIKFNISRERVRQIEVKALQKLQKAVKEEINKRNMVL